MRKKFSSILRVSSKMHILIYTLVAIVTSFSTISCVVTSAPTFETQTDCFPVLVTSETIPPANRFVHIDARSTAPQPANDVRFSATIQSCAVSKTFTAAVFLDDRFVAFQVLPTGDTRRKAEFILAARDLSRLVSGCHRVEMLISTSFLSDFRSPQQADDLTQTTWWVDLITDDETIRPVGDCQ
jgi:hypothetical protein